MVDLFVGGGLHELVEIIGDGGGILGQPVLAGPVSVAGEEHDAAARGTEAAEQAEHQRNVGDVGDLEGFLVAIVCELERAVEVPVVGVADDGGQGREFAVGDFGGDGGRESLDGGEAGEVQFTDRGFGGGEFGEGLAEGGGVGVGV